MLAQPQFINNQQIRFLRISSKSCNTNTTGNNTSNHTASGSLFVYGSASDSRRNKKRIPERLRKKVSTDESVGSQAAFLAEERAIKDALESKEALGRRDGQDHDSTDADQSILTTSELEEVGLNQIATRSGTLLSPFLSSEENKNTVISTSSSQRRRWREEQRSFERFAKKMEKSAKVKRPYPKMPTTTPITYLSSEESSSLPPPSAHMYDRELFPSSPSLVPINSYTFPSAWSYRYREALREYEGQWRAYMKKMEEEERAAEAAEDAAEEAAVGKSLETGVSCAGTISSTGASGPTVNHSTPAAKTSASDKPPSTSTSFPKPPTIRKIFKVFGHHLWPAGRWDLKALLVASMSSIILAKASKVCVPVMFKVIIDKMVQTQTVMSQAASGIAEEMTKSSMQEGAAAAALGTGATSVGATAASGASTSAFSILYLPTTLSLTQSVIMAVIAYGCAKLFSAAWQEAAPVFFSKIGSSASNNVNLDVFKKLHSLPFTYHAERSTGAVAKDMDRATRAFGELSKAVLFVFVPTCVELIFACGVMYTQAGLALASLTAVSVISYVLFTFLMAEWRAKYPQIFNRQETRLNRIVVDSLVNYETVKIFCNEQYEFQRIRALNNKINKTVVYVDLSLATMRFGQQLILISSLTAALILSAIQVQSGLISVGDFVLVESLMLQLFTPLSTLGTVYRQAFKAAIDMEGATRLLGLANEREPSTALAKAAAAAAAGQIRATKVGRELSHDTGLSIDLQPPSANIVSSLSPTHSIPLQTQVYTHNLTSVSKDILQQEKVPVKLQEFTPGDYTIEFRNVSFWYSDDHSVTHEMSANDSLLPPPNKHKPKKILRSISLTIPGGSTVAFVGPSGCGKSTILRLLYQFVTPTAGQILVDGQDLATLRLNSYRPHVGVVPQDLLLFNDTIRFNIRYGNLEASNEEVEEAARLAHIHEAIMRMPLGYDTVVGDRGLRLSGGEKQRLAIARFLLKKTPILLADESTSALDTATESNVMKLLIQTTRDPILAHPATADGGGSQPSESSSTDEAVSSNSSATAITTVLVAHRLSTIRSVDCIYVLNERGRLVEQGTHEALMALGPDIGKYCQMWYEQHHYGLPNENGGEHASASA